MKINIMFWLFYSVAIGLMILAIIVGFMAGSNTNHGVKIQYAKRKI